MITSIQPSSIPIQFGPIIAQGSFATIHLAKYVRNHQSQDRIWRRDITQDRFVAIKRIQNQNSIEHIACIENEIKILSMCSDIKLVAQMEFAFQTESATYIGLEYCTGGDLYTLVSGTGIVNEQAVNFLAQIAMGLHHLHQRNIIYHDLKLENVCIDASGQVRLVDFGLATVLDTVESYNPETQRLEVVSSGGTVEYSAPEIFLRLSHGYEADWWSFGVLAYELLCGELPFFVNGVSLQQQCEYICSDSDFHRNDIIYEGSVEEAFITMFLQKDQSRRFGYRQYQNEMKLLENHPFFQHVVHILSVN